MARLLNPLAPHLAGTLSPDVEAGVKALLASGALADGATPDEAALRRDARAADEESVMRPAFLRDTEKIIHMPAYNRLSGKTQVFSFAANDDLTRRGLHVQLVARVARDIGRALGLNLDLIEAMALGHDLGHTPFGHAGEHFLNDVFHERSGLWFMHNVQSVRVLDVLYGRNIALQTLDGALCHNGEFVNQRLKTSGLADFGEFDRRIERCWAEGPAFVKTLRPMTKEGCVVRLSDIIAYVGKDRQDAVRAGLVGEDAFRDGLGGGYNAWALSAFVADIVNESFGKPEISMSEEGYRELARAKEENYEKIYRTHEVAGDFSEDIQELFSALYDHELESLASGDESRAIFHHHIIPLEAHLAHYGRTYDWKSSPDQTVADFISAMTDDYFIATCERLFPEARRLFPKRSYFDYKLPVREWEG